MEEDFRLELRHLRYFIAVAEELHFRNAAKRLYITQPGLSRQIQDLEGMIGAKLLERSNKRVSLTEAGTYFYHESISILNQIEQTIRSTQLVAHGETGEIRIGFVGSAMHSVLPDVLAKMNKEFPSLHSVLEQFGNIEQIDLLHHNQIDIGFIRSEIIPEEMNHQQVYEENFALVLPKSHTLNVHNFQNLCQLKEENFILFSQSYSYDYYHLVMSIFADHGFQPKVTHRSVHASTIFHLVENGMGVAIIPTSLQKGFDLDIKFIELNSFKQRTVLNAVWKTDNKNPALRSFLKLI